MNKTTIIAFLAEFGPLLTFFVTGQLTSFFVAVLVLMIATVLAVSLSWWIDKRIPWFPVLSATVVLLGGAITLLFHTPDAIILADTIYYGGIAVAIGLSLRSEKTLIERLFGGIFALTKAGWQKLSWRWFTFLLLAAVANEVARHTLTPDLWIDYRLYKSIIVSLFAVSQFGLTRHYRLPTESNAWGLRAVLPLSTTPVGQPIKP